MQSPTLQRTGGKYEKPVGLGITGPGMTDEQATRRESTTRRTQSRQWCASASCSRTWANNSANSRPTNRLLRNPRARIERPPRASYTRIVRCMGEAAGNQTFSTRAAARILAVPPERIRYWVKRQFINPTTLRGRNFRFAFNDLILMRLAKELLPPGVIWSRSSAASIACAVSSGRCARYIRLSWKTSTGVS